MCLSSSSLALTSSSPQTSEERRQRCHGHVHGQSLLPDIGYPTLTKGCLVHQRFSIQISPVGHKQFYQVHLQAASSSCLAEGSSSSQEPTLSLLLCTLTWPQ